MKGFLDSLYILVMCCVLIFGEAITWTRAEVQCPKQCSCVNNTANCTNSNLKYIPFLPNNTINLDFSGNDLSSVNKSTFTNISRLHIEDLILYSCKIKTITTDALSPFRNIKSLDIGKNFLSYKMLKDGLRGLEGKEIQSLMLNSMENLTGVLPNNLFESLSKTNLSIMSLADNDIENIDGDAFSKLPRLKKLNLSDNFLGIIRFKKMHPSLTVLDLSKNEMTRLPVLYDKHKCFVPNLKRLIIDDNHISDLNLGLNVSCLTNLEYLSATFNPIGIIKEEQFLHFKSLRELDLNYLFVQRLRLKERAFSSHTLHYLRIGVPRHKLTKDQLNIFDNCSKLKILEIGGLRVWNLTDQDLTRLLGPVRNLTNLRIKSASLRGIPSIISKMGSLEKLSLFNNYISHWNINTFKELRLLRYLDLANNRISVINKTSFPDHFLTGVISLRLEFNPYACTCDNYWFIQWAKRAYRKLGNDFPVNFRCSSPAWLNEQPLLMYNPTFIQCNGLELYQSACLAAGVTIFILLVTLAIYKRYKWHIRYYLYLLRSKKEVETNSLLANDTFKYDAFVAYTSEDRSWVVSNLMAVLEGEHNFSLCLHERDFLPGRTILDQISETIKHSRKVILVLSTNFAKSLWCQYEILLAQNKLIEDGGNALILIVLDEVKDKYMTNCLCMLLRTVTYIKWTSNNEGKKLFWNKVVMSLKH